MKKVHSRYSRRITINVPMFNRQYNSMEYKRCLSTSIFHRTHTGIFIMEILQIYDDRDYDEPVFSRYPNTWNRLPAKWSPRRIQSGPNSWRHQAQVCNCHYIFHHITSSTLYLYRGSYNGCKKKLNWNKIFAWRHAPTSWRLFYVCAAHIMNGWVRTTLFNYQKIWLIHSSKRKSRTEIYWCLG